MTSWILLALYMDVYGNVTSGIVLHKATKAVCMAEAKKQRVFLSERKEYRSRAGYIGENVFIRCLRSA